jgi:L-alanine-DL-glutamate epimerase-like enolase superfamily enzyme
VESTAKLLAAAWAAVARSEAVNCYPLLRDATWSMEDGGEDYGAGLATERFRAVIGLAVLDILGEHLPRPVAAAAWRDVVRTCNSAYGMLAWRLAKSAVMGLSAEEVVAAAETAVVEAIPFLESRFGDDLARAARV